MSEGSDNLIIGFLVVIALLVAVYVMMPELFITAEQSDKVPVVNGPVGGAVPKGTAAAVAPIIPKEPVEVASVPVVKVIEAPVAVPTVVAPPTATTPAVVVVPAPVKTPAAAVNAAPVVTNTPTATIVTVPAPMVQPAPAASSYVTPAPAVSAPTAPASVPVALPSINVKKIVFSRNVTVLPSAGSQDETFQIGEVMAYDSTGRKLTAADYSGAAYGAGTQYSSAYPASALIDDNINSYTNTAPGLGLRTITLTLKNPTNLSKIDVYNRQSCCQNRLAGVTMTLYDAGDVVIYTKTLTADKVQNYTMTK